MFKYEENKMNKNNKLTIVISALILFALFLGACAPAAPISEAEPAAPEQVIVENTVVVEKEVIVKVTEAPAPQQPPEPVTLTYYTFSAAPDHMEELGQMIQIFEASHPNIKINVETAPFDNYFTKLQTLIAGGMAPDIFELNYENFVTYAAKGLLLDLNPLTETDASFDASIYYPRANEPFSYNNMQLGLPATFSTVVLYYNKDLFDQAGVAYPQEDWTWADAVEAGKQLTDPAAGVYGLHSGIQFWEFYKKAAQNNCQFFNEDKTEVLINSPECVQALETMISFVETEKIMPSQADMGGLSDGDMFLQGKLAMDVTGIWMFAAFADAPFAWDIEVEPGMATHATHFFANAVSVFAASKHPQEAWEWVKFFTSDPEMARIRVESGWELAALSNPAFFDEYLQQSPPDNRQAVFNSLKYAVVPPVIERQGEFQDAVGLLLDQARLGQITPQQALDQAKIEIEALLQ
jgi:multiple sugar transport system substrate-binding protein